MGLKTTTRRNTQVCADLYVSTSSSLIVVFRFYIDTLKNVLVEEDAVYVPLIQKSTYRKPTGSPGALPLQVPVCLLMSNSLSLPSAGAT